MVCKLKMLAKCSGNMFDLERVALHPQCLSAGYFLKKIDGISTDHLLVFTSMNHSNWALPLLNQIQSACRDGINKNGVCHVMLTGGRSAASFYSVWAASVDSPDDLRGMHFYFGDERCVPSDDSESNYSMAVNRLFPDGIPRGVQFHRMEADSLDLDDAACRYDDMLPEVIDVLLLSVGEDGHIASLFPHSAALHESTRTVVPITGPKSPHKRLTITPKVIQTARHVFVMAIGEQKKTVYKKAMQLPDDVDSIPARLVLDKTWIIGD